MKKPCQCVNYAESKHVPILLCANQCDAYHITRIKGKGTFAKPQFSDEAGVLWLLQRLQETILKARKFCRKANVWMTQLDKSVVDENILLAFKKLQNPEEFKREYLQIFPPDGGLNSDTAALDKQFLMKCQEELETFNYSLRTVATLPSL